MKAERITRKWLHLQIASLISQRATCARGEVGCVIVTPDHRIISSGYNGPVRGSGHCNELKCDISQKCQHSVHAEANAIAAAAKNGISIEDCTMYLTTSPCYECAKLIIQSGIAKVIFSSQYRDKTALKYLVDNGIELEEVTEDTVKKHEPI